jgi:PilZ domain
MSSIDSRHRGQDRRGYFRVKDELVLFFNEVNKEHEDSAQGLKYRVVSGFSVSSALNQLSEECRTRIKIVERENPDLTACLKILDKKIDLIAQALLISDLSLPNYSTRKVDLSASGLAFPSERAIAPGTILELKIVLPPSLVAIVAHGRVVHSETRVDPRNAKYGFHIGVEFIGLEDCDRELLIRHVLRKQTRGFQSKRRIR